MTTAALNPDELQELEIPPASATAAVSAADVNANYPFQPQQLIMLFNHDQWEEFVREWAHFQKQKYTLVARLGGANDYGIDVAGFRTGLGFLGPWDNYQCKHYSDPLGPSAAFVEIGKILWHSFEKRITVPQNYYFFAPKDCGDSLKKLLLNSEKLKEKVLGEWQKRCKKKISSSYTVELTGTFLAYVQSFDFGIFQYKPNLEVIEEHRETPYHTARFGGGLTGTPKCIATPVVPAEEENRYVEQLLEAYSDCGQPVESYDKLDGFPEFRDHFNRSRHTFYDAEALEVFARDTVTEGTFPALQEEVYYGVKDVEEDEFDTALRRVKEVTKTASSLNVSASGLGGVVTPKRLRGICHQLANQNKLIWRKK